MNQVEIGRGKDARRAFAFDDIAEVGTQRFQHQ
jgi:hypothetical protein